MYFKQVFDDELIKHIADQTNLYSVKCTGKSRNVDENETEQYFGILLYSCLPPSWNKKNTSFEEVKRTLIVQVYVNLCNILFSL